MATNGTRSGQVILNPLQKLSEIFERRSSLRRPDGGRIDTEYSEKRIRATVQVDPAPDERAAEQVEVGAIGTNLFAKTLELVLDTVENPLRRSVKNISDSDLRPRRSVRTFRVLGPNGSVRCGRTLVAAIRILRESKSTSIPPKPSQFARPEPSADEYCRGIVEILQVGALG
jgi:hypothetical protein